MTSRGGRYVALGIALIATITGCSSGSNDPSSARAELDSTTGEIVLPLDQYQFVGSDQQLQELSQAWHITVGECMQGRGFPYSAASAEIGELAGERRYGLWQVDRARIYGYSLPVSVFFQASAEDAAAYGPEWEAAKQECEQSSTPPLSNEQTAESLGTRLSDESYALAQEDALWDEVADEYLACIEAEGLTASGERDWMSAESLAQLSLPGADGGSEESIRLAVIEATCNEQVQVTQRLGDLEAGIQEQLIDDHEAALQALQGEIDTAWDEIHDYIAEHG